MTPAEEVALACRVMASVSGGEDLIWGHVSRRDPDGRGAWMKASGWGFEEIDAERVVLVDRHGDVLDGSERRHLEYPIHTEILAVRPDAGAVVHVHSPHAVAFAATGVPLRPISHDATLFVPPDVVRFTRTGDLVATPEMGAGLAEDLGGRNAALMVHHGLVAVGADVPTAMVTAFMLERACRLQLLAMGAGTDLTWSGDDEALSKRDVHFSAKSIDALWRYLVRRATENPRP
jgi:ribulose-5-phosphate 4-epimerase/fuculose-1-phosphate aldolase